MRTSPASAGFTFFEMVAALTVLAVIGGLGIKAIQLTGRASADTVQGSELDQRAHRALRRIVRDLQEARMSAFVPAPTPPLGASTIVYQCAEVLDIQFIDWGENRRIDLVPSSTDPLDGVDNDRDGLVDEHDLVLVRDAGLASERSTVLVRNVAPLLEGELPNALDDNGNGLVDEPGFCVLQRGEMLDLALSLMRVAPGGGVTTRTAETTVWPRN
jgi:hypothetical protein